MLPRDADTSEAVSDWERRHFFGLGWTCAGLSEVLAKPGSRQAVPTGTGSTLLVRDRDGAVRAFANACRHRAHELLAGATSAELPLIIRCPYHRWTYHLDGSLNRAPGFGAGALNGIDPPTTV